MEAIGKRYIYYPPQTQEITIYNLSDLHYGNKACAIDEIRKDVQTIRNDPYSFAVGGGDYSEAISMLDTRFDPSVIDEDIKVKDLGQLGKILTDKVGEILSPIKDKIIGLLYGNHEDHYQRWMEQAGLHQGLCDSLGVPNLGYSALFDIVFVPAEIDKPKLSDEKGSGWSVRFFVHHGAGFAVTPGGKLNKLINFMNYFDADIIMCVDEETEIMTTNGFKKYNEIKVGEKIFSFNCNKDSIERDSISDIIIRDHADEMIHFKNKIVDMLLTPDHRVVYKPTGNKTTDINIHPWHIKTANDLNKHTGVARFPMAGFIDNVGVTYSDDLVALAGWIIAEGHFHKTEKLGGSAISIYQKLGEKAKRIKQLLDNLKIKYTTKTPTWKEPGVIYYICAEHAKYLQRFLVFDKNIPDWCFNMNKYQFEIFFEALIDGDGSRHGNNMSYFSINENLIDRLQVLTTIHGYRSRKAFKPGGFKNGCWCLNICKSEDATYDFTKKPPQNIKHSGKVWCVKTNNTTFIARRNGRVFITGNCGHVHDQQGRRQPHISADPTCKKLTVREQLGVISGSYLKTYKQGIVTYGEKRGYAPTVLGSAAVHLDPNKRTYRGDI